MLWPLLLHIKVQENHWKSEDLFFYSFATPFRKTSTHTKSFSLVVLSDIWSDFQEDWIPSLEVTLTWQIKALGNPTWIHCWIHFLQEFVPDDCSIWITLWKCSPWLLQKASLHISRAAQQQLHWLQFLDDNNKYSPGISFLFPIAFLDPPIVS